MTEYKDNMTLEELNGELLRLKECLCDLEDLHSFTFNKSSLHIGSERAQNMQEEFEADCNNYRERISLIERLIHEKRAYSG